MNVSRFLIAGACGGLLFGVLDGLLNANPLGQRMLAYLKPIAREGVAMAAGLVIDLLWGFAMAGMYLLLRPSLPGQFWVWKGLSFAALAWFFRVLMRAASDALMLKIPPASAIYQIVGGGVEMALLGLLYGLLLA